MSATSLQSRTIGFEVWSATRRDANDSPVGGVIVEVSEKPDMTTGELVRFYRVLDPYRLRPCLVWHTMAESEVDPANLVGPAPSARVAALIRRLCEEVAFSGPYKHRKGQPTPEHVTYLSYARMLAGAL